MCVILDVKANLLRALLQACARELRAGQQIWSQVLANSAAHTFQADPGGAAYLTALQHIWRIALLLQAAAELHGFAPAEQNVSHAAFEEASRQSMDLISGELSAE